MHKHSYMFRLLHVWRNVPHVHPSHPSCPLPCAYSPPPNPTPVSYRLLPDLRAFRLPILIFFNKKSSFFFHFFPSLSRFLLPKMLAETNPIILAITMVVSVMHSVFNFLAFKNDISFWKDKKRSASHRVDEISSLCPCFRVC